MSQEMGVRAGLCTSIDGKYRYKYWRALPAGGPRQEQVCLFLMFHPTTEDEETRDTVHMARDRCATIAEGHGYGMLWTCNLFAFRCTRRERQELWRNPNPAGLPKNDEFIREAAEKAPTIVCAWGDGDPYASSEENYRFHGRVAQVVALLEQAGVEERLHALAPGLTAHGQPYSPAWRQMPKVPEFKRLGICNGTLGEKIGWQKLSRQRVSSRIGSTAHEATCRGNPQPW